VFQIKETPTCVGVRSLQMGSVKTECVLFSDAGNILPDTTMTVPLELLVAASRRDLNLIARHTLIEYYTKGKEFDNNHG
jgi:hypothetical protein